MDTNKFLMPAAVVLAGLFIAGAVVWNGQHPAQVAQGTTGSGQGAQVAVDSSKVKTAGEPYIGNPNAPVTIAFWSDFQCPFCKAFEVGDSRISTAPALPDIITNYVNTGKAKIVFKDFEFLGPNSLTDAEYARAIWALYQNEYFAWRTAMYTNQPEENSLTAAAQLQWILKTTGSVPGIDVTQVTAAVTANKTAYDAAIQADMQEGQSMGVSATPSFVIGKQFLAGAYPYANFDSAIKTALGQS